MFLKEKRDKTVKGRFCAEGRKQRGDWTKQESTSPTVLMESVFLTAVIDAHERRDVGCYDIPGAFLHADNDEDITMVLKGRLAELMVQVALNLYRKYITVDKRNAPILCAILSIVGVVTPWSNGPPTLSVFETIMSLSLLFTSLLVYSTSLLVYSTSLLVYSTSLLVYDTSLLV